MSTGLKNGGAIISSVLPVVHFSVNEQCVEYSECEEFAAFVDDSKPVFHIEYPNEVSSDVVNELCQDTKAATGAAGFSTVLKNLNLDGWVKECDGTTTTTPLSSGTY
jgi:hypothetical protein